MSLLECNNLEQVNQIKKQEENTLFFLFQKLHQCMDPSDIIQILRQVFLSFLETKTKAAAQDGNDDLFDQLPFVSIAIYSFGQCCTKYICAIFGLGHEIVMEAMQQMNGSLLRQALRLIAALDRADGSSQFKNDVSLYDVWFMQHFGPPPISSSTSASIPNASTMTRGSNITGGGLASTNVYLCPRGSSVNSNVHGTSTSPCISIQNKRNLEFFSAFLIEEANSSVQAHAHLLHVHIKVLKQHQRVTYPHALVDVISCLRQHLTRHALSLKAQTLSVLSDSDQMSNNRQKIKEKEEFVSKDQLWMETLIERMPLNRKKIKKLPSSLRPILLFQKKKFQQQIKVFLLKTNPKKPFVYSYKQTALVHLLYQEKLVSQKEYELFLQQMEQVAYTTTTATTTAATTTAATTTAATTATTSTTSTISTTSTTSTTTTINSTDTTTPL
jgi:hypothetical protein